MGPLVDAWFVLVVSMASWLNLEQSKALEYILAFFRDAEKGANLS